MDTCRGIHLNLGSFAHVAIDEGEGQALRFQMAGVGYSVGGEYAAVAVTGASLSAWSFHVVPPRGPSARVCALSPCVHACQKSESESESI